MSIDEIKAKMCDNYCKHVDYTLAEFKDVDMAQRALDMFCEKCPLNELEEALNDN